MLWVDTYFQWISPNSGCCGLVNGTDNDYCKDPGKGNCTVCLENYPKNVTRPNAKDFKNNIRQWLKSNPNKDCPAGGHAAFASGVILKENRTDVLSKSAGVSRSVPVP